MRKLCMFVVIAFTAALAIPLAASEAATQISKKKTLTPPPFFFTQQRDNSVTAAVKRGKKVFRDTGCTGCHPRGRTVGGTAVDVTGNRNPYPIPTLVGAAEHFPRLSAAGQVINLGQFNNLCATVFIGKPPMEPYSQKYKDLETYVSSLSPKLYKRMLSWEKKRKAFVVKMLPARGRTVGGTAVDVIIGNPCAAKNPCNPCAGKNPCARK